VAAYLDDIVVYSNSWEEHKGHIRTMFAQLQGAGLTVKPRKCQFAMAECLYLGHIVGNGCVCPEVSKLEAIESQQQKKQVRSLLGLTGYYRKFIRTMLQLLLLFLT